MRLRAPATSVSAATWPSPPAYGTGEGDVRDTHQTGDGAVSYVGCRGILDIHPDVWERIGAGEDVTASDYYLRGQPMFETGSEKYDLLNKIVAVSIGKLEAMT